jgi:mannose-6-phosphate isomerase-like protein (cupin superfamily)
VRWERLTWRTRNDFEFLHVVYEVGSASCEPGMLLQHGGEEYAFVLAGTLKLTVGDETFSIGPGDSISFDAQQPHRIWNPGKVPASAIWVVLQRRFDERAG